MCLQKVFLQATHNELMNKLELLGKKLNTFINSIKSKTNDQYTNSQRSFFDG